MAIFDQAVFDRTVFDGGLGFQFLQVASKDSGAVNSDTLAFGSNVAANSLILVQIRLGDTTTDVSTIIDTLGANFTQVIAPQIQTTDGHRELLWVGLKTPGAGADTVTVNLTAVPGSFRWSIYEYRADGTQVQDTARSGQQNATSTPNTGGNLTPAGNNELLFAAVTFGGTPSVAGTGNFTTRNDDGGGLKHGAVDWIQGTGTPTDAGISLGAADNCAVILAAFKLVAGGVGGDGGGATLMGQAIF